MIPFNAHTSPKGFFPGNPYVLWNSRPAKNGQPPPCYGQCNINIGTRKVGAAMKRLPQIFMGPKAKEQILQRWDPVSRTIVNVRCPCTNPVQAEAPPPHPPPEPDVVVTRFYANIYPDDFRSIDNDSRVTYIITFTSSLSSAYTGTFKIGFNNASESYEDATILTDSSPHINYPATESLLYTKDVPRPSYIFGQLIFDEVLVSR
jgi:hypothetical protein